MKIFFLFFFTFSFLRSSSAPSGARWVGHPSLDCYGPGEDDAPLSDPFCKVATPSPCGLVNFCAPLPRTCQVSSFWKECLKSEMAEIIIDEIDHHVGQMSLAANPRDAKRVRMTTAYIIAATRPQANSLDELPLAILLTLISVFPADLSVLIPLRASCTTFADLIPRESLRSARDVLPFPTVFTMSDDVDTANIYHGKTPTTRMQLSVPFFWQVAEQFMTWELWRTIFFHLDVATMPKFAQACRFFSNIAQSFFDVHQGVFHWRNPQREDLNKHELQIGADRFPVLSFTLVTSTASRWGRILIQDSTTITRLHPMTIQRLIINHHNWYYRQQRGERVDRRLAFDPPALPWEHLDANIDVHDEWAQMPYLGNDDDS